LYKPKSNDKGPAINGIAMFYKCSRFNLLQYKEVNFKEMMNNLQGTDAEELNKNTVAQLLVLSFVEYPSEGIIVGNTHLFWNWKYEWVRLKQACRFLEELDILGKQFNFPIISGGDYNIAPDSPIYQFLTSRSIPKDCFNKFLLPSDHNDPEINSLMKTVEDSMSGISFERQPSTQQDLKRMDDVKELLDNSKNLPLMHSVYHNYTSLDPNASKSEFWTGEPSYTSFSVWKGTLDYIFIVQGERKIIPQALLEIPSVNELSKQVGLPSDFYPSDHIPIQCKFFT